MPRVRRSRLSIFDYKEIWRYIARDDAKAADRLISVFEQKLTLFATMPAMGKEEPDLEGSLRSVPVGNYLLYYRPFQDGIELVRALHAARDITAEFFAEK